MSLRENLTVGDVLERLLELVRTDARIMLSTPTTVRGLKLSGPEIRQLVFDGVANTDYKKAFEDEKAERLRIEEELRLANARISELEMEIEDAVDNSFEASDRDNQ